MGKYPSYLNEGKAAGAGIKKIIYLILGVPLAVFFGFGLIASFTDETVAESHGMAVSIVFLIPAFFLIRNGIRAGREAGLARRYSSIFSADSNGTVDAKELCTQTGKSAETIAKELENLIRKGLLQGVTLQYMPLEVILSDSGQKHGFVSVTCPHCGGTARIRAGISGNCEFCGGALNADRTSANH